MSDQTRNMWRRICQLLGHNFSLCHSMLDPSPELLDYCDRCGEPRVSPTGADQ